ncbi:hypothetical protein [Globicatella sanguinis]|uniref:hypothetical protein n=1 Tax=Globicatella sanguinis TaxID=13076 RepID=UPI0008252DB1|nr:hypothetical protein [Globicatella sanguinis]
MSKSSEQMLNIAKSLIESINPDDVVRVVTNQGTATNGYEGITIDIIFSEPTQTPNQEKVDEWMA